MDYDKILYYNDTNKMSHAINSLTSPIPTTTGGTFKVAATAVAPHYQQLTTSDAYSTYADYFDLSLLPQDCVSTSSENIPTTVYQYNNDLRSPVAPETPVATPTTTPQIKIEQTWSLPTADIKQEQNQNYIQLYDQLNSHPQQQQQQQFSHPKSPHQLIPPASYRQPYPSPQSSPAQSEYGFPSSQFAGCYDSLSSSRSSLYPSSPCPSLDTTCIKQELHILPPSPPESNCEAASPHSSFGDIKSEPFDADVETLIDLNSLFEKTFNDLAAGRKLSSNAMAAPATPAATTAQNQVLREYLEDDSFQKKHNLRPLALDSFIGDLTKEVRNDIEPVISLALQHAKLEADETCAKLHISQDPSVWSPVQVHAWLRSTIGQFKLQPIDDLEAKFCEDGAAFVLLSEEEFQRRAPESGSTLHAQLEIWKMAYSDGYNGSGSSGNHMAATPIAAEQHAANPSNLPEPTTTVTASSSVWSINGLQSFSMDTEDDSDDEDERIAASTNVATAAAAAAPATGVSSTTAAVGSSTVATTTTAPTDSIVVVGGVKQKSGRSSGTHIHLWQFLKELLAAPHSNGTAIRWIDRNKGVFKIEDSVRVAKMWGRRKNRPAMNYDKLSRSIRQYYKKGIMKKTERSQRLVYQFCAPYHL